MDSDMLNLIEESYNKSMFTENEISFVDRIGFFNMGYWRGSEASVELAQLRLIETLVQYFPVKEGRILDVACGRGASTKFLTKYFYPQSIFGINISERQLEMCKTAVPECNFMMMDATKLNFSDSYFNYVLCIEAAFHFNSRRDFFREAYRVLRPGGRLAMSDIVFKDAHDLPPIYSRMDPVSSLDDYRVLLLEAGFSDVVVEDSTNFSIRGLEGFLADLYGKGVFWIGKNSIESAIKNTRMFADSCLACCMVYAAK